MSNNIGNNVNYSWQLIGMYLLAFAACGLLLYFNPAEKQLGKRFFILPMLFTLPLVLYKWKSPKYKNLAVWFMLLVALGFLLVYFFCLGEIKYK